MTEREIGDIMSSCGKWKQLLSHPQESKCATDDMSNYEILEHTADTGITASGNTLAEAYAAAAQGMFSIMTDPDTIRETGTRRVTVKADDAEGLLFEWLNELLYYFDVELILFRGFDIIEFSQTSLTADCHGEKYDPSRHEIKTGIKSATYHLMEVDAEHHKVTVIFDV